MTTEQIIGLAVLITVLVMLVPTMIYRTAYHRALFLSKRGYKACISSGYDAEYKMWSHPNVLIDGQRKEVVFALTDAYKRERLLDENKRLYLPDPETHDDYKLGDFAKD